MQTNLADFIRNTPHGREADDILRKCVHCGFCTATCPTYQLLGDELDSPRGRIYLIKQVLEGRPASARTQLHLDRCLSCRSCETTCPSGVRYGRLADIGREVIENQVSRPVLDRAARRALRAVLPYSSRFTALLRLGQAMRGVLPGPLKRKVPPRRHAPQRPQPRHARRMLMLEGCAQPGIAPEINARTARVLDRLGISVEATPGAGCCGAVSHHLSAHEEALDFMRRNVDAWWPRVEAGAEAIIVTASGCGAQVREYGDLLAHDPAYAERARRISGLSRDIAEVIAAEDLDALPAPPPRRVAFHSPCSLQHALRVRGTVESLLRRAGHELTPVADTHLCCGSAGTYSILQPTLSKRLLANKVEALEGGGPEVIATANIGCLAHLETGTAHRVVHWIELLDT
jgi:glycolate oxidase iron-sulfur subunit